MNLRILLLAVCLGMVPAFSAEERRWLSPEAEYRLTVRPDVPAEATSVDLRRFVLPVLPENGVRVFDDTGAPVAFQLHGNEMLAIAPSPKAKQFEIYFGFPEKQPMDSWTPNSGPRPAPERLRLTFFGGGNRPCTPDEFLTWRNSDIERRNRWQVKSFAERPFLTLARLRFGLRPVPWIINFSQYWKIRQAQWKRLNTRNRWQWYNTGLELTGQPEIRSMESFINSWQRQMKTNFDYIKRELTRIEKLYEQARNEKPSGAENDLLGITGWKNPRIFPATEVQLLLRPPETPEHYSACFSGLLDVPRDGEYEFELLSNSLAILRLDGKALLRRNDADGSQPVTRQTAKINLKQGSVPFELFYRLNNGFGQLTVRMRPAGEGEFRLLAAENFSPARPAVPVELASRKNGYPCVMRRGHYLFFTDKRDWVPVEGFRFPVSPAEVEWRVGDGEYRPAAELPPALVLSRDPAKRLSFRFAGRPETELPVLYSDYRVDMVELHPDLSLRLWAPPAIYEDEMLPVTLEAVSSLPFEVEAFLDIVMGEGSPEKRGFRLPGKQDERFDRAAADVYHKETVLFSPENLKSGGLLEAKLSIGNFRFDRKLLTAVRVSSDAQFGELARKGDVVLILHRPTLGDIRSWELPRKIGDELLSGRKMLLIAEPAEGAEEQVRNRLKAKKRELEFLTFDDSEEPLRSSLFRLLDGIGKSDADHAVLMLPCLRHLGTLEPWMRDRFIAVLLERLQSNRKIRTVFLAPGAFYADDAKEMEELLNALRRLSREYSVRLLEPGQGGASRPEGKEYRTHTAEDVVRLLDRLDRAR